MCTKTKYTLGLKQDFFLACPTLVPFKQNEKAFLIWFPPSLLFFYPQAAGASTPSTPNNSTQPSVTSFNLTPTQPSANPTSIPESLPTHPDSTESSLTPDNGSPPSQPAEASATSNPGTGESATVRPISSPSVTFCPCFIPHLLIHHLILW